MSDAPMWRRYLRFLGTDVEADIDEELQFHLESRQAQLIERGMSPERARDEALRRLGNVREIREECREIGRSAQRIQRRRERLAMIHQDLQRAMRSLGRSPGFTLIATLTLALGIGATTAIFTVLNAVVLEPLDYPDSGRLVSIKHPVPGENTDWEWGLSTGGYYFFRENSRALEDIGLYNLSEMTLSGDGVAENVQAAMVSASLFPVLRAQPLHGRLLISRDNRDRSPDSPFGVAVLGHRFWRDRFGADPGVIGSTVEVEGTLVEVVGVAEPDLNLPNENVALWLPMYLDPGMYHANSHQYAAIARLRTGVSAGRAEAELARLTERLTEAVPTAYSPSFMRETQFSTIVRPLRDEIVGGIDRMLWILLGAVGVVLLIASANVANLFLVRMENRRREVAIRSALGAARGQLVSRYLAEGVLLTSLAGFLGIILAHAGIQLLLSLAPADIPRLSEIALGWKSVGFAAMVSLLAGVMFGLFPLFQVGISYSALRDGGRGTTASRARNAVRRALVVGQVALSLVLLAAAGLLLQTFRNLHAMDPGLEAEGALTLDVSLPFADYPSYEKVAAFYRDLTTRVQALPGVQSAGAITGIPLGGGYEYGCNLVFPENWDAREERYPCVSTAHVAPGYFEALGIPVRGEASGWNENEQRIAGVVVSRSFAERVWPGEDPVGKGVTAYMSRQPHFRVVGVAGDVRAAGLDRPPVELVYFPMIPVEGARLWDPPRSMTLVVKSATTRPEELVTAVRRIVSEIDPGVPLGAVQRMEGVVAESTASISFTMLLLGIAATVALLLGAVGLYGVLSYVVGQRTHEIGIRVALGAHIQQVASLVVRQALALALVGVAVGLVAAVLVTRVLQSLLFEVSPTDPLILTGVALLLVVVALVASYVPARRATRVDPMVALRTE
jgi:putative ABC transport system permease protein